eukprot:COSAG06_NODE_576_length_14051_cov_5.354644_13_plen_97_part_00
MRIEPGGRVDAVLVWFELELLSDTKGGAAAAAAAAGGEGEAGSSTADRADTSEDEGRQGREQAYRLNTGPEEAGVLGHWGQALYVSSATSPTPAPS